MKPKKSLYWVILFLSLRMQSVASVENEKRSLVIVFDTTGSMHRDLQQVKSAVIQIVREFSSSGKDAIHNYVLSPFNDPGFGPLTITTNSAEFIKTLSGIKIGGGGDCPEMALSGIVNALQNDAILKPIVFVVTDADSKDSGKYSRVSELVQSTQAQIHFLLTNSCTRGRFDPIYEKVASLSGGMIYDLKKEDVSNVLLFLKRTLEQGAITISTVFYDRGGRHQTPINIDDTLNKVVITLTGKDPLISITGPDGQLQNRITNLMNLHNIKAIEINDPIAGTYILTTSSSSLHHVSVEGQSNVTMDYGFTLTDPGSITNNSYQPIKNENNIITIKVTNGVSTIGQLNQVLLKSNVKFVNVSLKYKERDRLYVSDPFVPPNELFKIVVVGNDKEGNVFERTISTNVEPTRNILPIITIKDKKKIFVGDSIDLLCSVDSLTSPVIQWKKGDSVLEEIRPSSSERNHKIIHKFTNMKVSDSGRYLCIAKNDFGSRTLYSDVLVNQLPVVTVSPKTLTVPEDGDLRLRCDVKNVDRTATVFWKYNNNKINEPLPADHSLVVPKIKRQSKGQYTCVVNYFDLAASDTATVTVNYPPKFNSLETPNTFLKKFGETVSMDCSSTGLPEPEVQWSHLDLNRKPFSKERRLESHSKFTVGAIKPEDEGVYVCTAKNSVGQVSRDFSLKGISSEKPKLEQLKDKIITKNVGDKLEVPCICRGCKPITKHTWYTNINVTLTSDNMRADNMIVTREDLKGNNKDNYFNYLLKFDGVQEYNKGNYSCEVENDYGKDRMEFILVVNISDDYDS